MPRPAFPYLSGQFVAGALEETDESNLAAHKRVLKHSIMASASFAEYSGRCALELRASDHTDRIHECNI